MANKWTPKVMFPTDSNFMNRIIDAAFAPSNGGNPMITIETEVVTPAEVEIGTETYNIAGVTTKNYFVAKSLENGEVNEEKTANCQKNIRELWEKLGLDSASIDFDNIDVKPLKGMLILTMMSPEISEQRKSPTAAQIEAAKKTGKRAEGDIMKNPITGKAMIQYFPKVREIFGLAPEGAATGNSGSY